jgi:hypothetical protein
LRALDTADLGIDMFGPLARKWMITEIDRVTTLAFTSAMATI